jgi:hypothetical protein
MDTDDLDPVCDECGQHYVSCRCLDDEPDTPDELDQDQANAALTVLREIKRRQEG